MILGRYPVLRMAVLWAYLSMGWEEWDNGCSIFGTVGLHCLNNSLVYFESVALQLGSTL